MGSGLILLVIVAAWLAVLVPMALRSHESSTASSSVDRFSDAMRVLSRRDAAARAQARRDDPDDPLSAQAWAENDEWDDDWDEYRPSWRERLGEGRRRAVSAVAPVAGSLSGRLAGTPSSERPASSPAVRRRRLLLALVALTVLSAGAGVVGPRVLLLVAGVLAVAVALFVVQLRRLAVARTARERRVRTAARRPAPQPVRSTAVRVTPRDVPAEAALPVAEPVAEPVVEPVVEPVAVPAAVAVRYDEAPPPPFREDPWPVFVPAAVRRPAGALGGAWSPVPVPPPVYATKPVARAARTVDLTRPGAWSREQVSRMPEELPGTAPVSAPVPERRRAVNEW